MAEDIGSRLERMRETVKKLLANNDRVEEMMRLRVADGMGAMVYGQYGGSFPDPTPGAVFDVHGDIYGPDGLPVPVRWRDRKPEQDIYDYKQHIAAAERELVWADEIRRRHMAADRTADGKLDIRLRLDPNDWCRLHWHLSLYEGHRRHKDGLCKVCLEFRDGSDKMPAMGREPTTTEIDHWHRHSGAWPHKLWDPKERRAV